MRVRDLIAKLRDVVDQGSMVVLAAGGGRIVFEVDGVDPTITMTTNDGHLQLVTMIFGDIESGDVS